MEIKIFRDQLKQKYTPRPKKIVANSNFEKEESNLKQNVSISNLINIMGYGFESQEISKSVDDTKLKVIGITGSRGKSSVAFIIHEYFKKLGYKSVLYSSIKIDSPLSFCAENTAVENPLMDEQMILDAIDEAIEYKADFLIMEVNERAISKGLTKDIPFDIRVITNIIPNHNYIFYSDYVDIKKKFFREAKSDVTLISALINKETIELKNELSNRNYKTYSSKYISGVYKLNENEIDFLLKQNDKQFESIDGLNMSIQTRDGLYDVSTNLIMPYNALNITCCIGILKTLNVYNHYDFQNLVKNIVIPGRDEVIRVANRTIFISTNLVPHLENLKRYKQNGEINNIRLVTGSTGLNFISWTKEFSDEKYLQEKEFAIKFAYNYIKDNCDIVYITTTDTGAANKELLLDYQASLLNNAIPYEKVLDRSFAIKKAIESSSENDVIFISGRGNRHIMCDSKDTIILHLDKDVVIKVLNELNWL